MISFIDEQRGRFGVEPICRPLPIAPSTYNENVAKRLDVDRLSIRARSDIGLKIEIRRVFEQNFRVYVVCKVLRQLKREGFDVARCTIARLMRSMSLQGVIRGKPIRTTLSEKSAPSPFDRVNRQFKAADTLRFQQVCLDHFPPALGAGRTQFGLDRGGDMFYTSPAARRCFHWKLANFTPLRQFHAISLRES